LRTVQIPSPLCFMPGPRNSSTPPEIPGQPDVRADCLIRPKARNDNGASPREA
jgi:hypothetical protein